MKLFYLYFQIIIDRTTWVTNPGDKIPPHYRLDNQLLIPLYIYIFLNKN